jgi:glycosyltransferase involved in cell wall biosynthesis
MMTPPTAAGRPAGKILFSVNAAWNVVNFRAGLIGQLLADGYAVTVATPRDAFSSQIEQLGCRYVELPMQPQGRSPVADLGLLARYVRLMRAERFDAFLGFTAKPNIYGSLAAALCGVPTVNNIAGLGLVFNEQGPASRIIRMLYRLALRRSAHVFFQNADDLALFGRERLVDVDKAELLPGSGVDLQRFRPLTISSSAATDPGRFVFLLVARLLWEKGVAELVEAGRIVRAAEPGAEIRLLGFVEDGKPAFVQASDLEQWQRAGLATYLGSASDVRPHLEQADCVVLPSYYPEGTPRALLEGAAMGKPIITCDMPGCRDVVADGENGFLVPPRNAQALAGRMLDMVRLSPARRAAMGQRSRAIVEARFDEQIVVGRYADILRRLVASGGRG